MEYETKELLEKMDDDIAIIDVVHSALVHDLGGHQHITDVLEIAYMGLEEHFYRLKDILEREDYEG